MNWKPHPYYISSSPPLHSLPPLAFASPTPSPPLLFGVPPLLTSKKKNKCVPIDGSRGGGDDDSDWRERLAAVFIFVAVMTTLILLILLTRPHSGTTCAPTASPETASPTAADRCFVFVTSTTYQGNLGNKTGADAKCVAHAAASGNPAIAAITSWEAWLSYVSPPPHAVLPLLSPNGPHPRCDSHIAHAVALSVFFSFSPPPPCFHTPMLRTALQAGQRAFRRQGPRSLSLYQRWTRLYTVRAPPASPPGGTPSTFSPVTEETRFRLDDAFVRDWRNEDPNFGFDGLGELTYKRSYARLVPGGDGRLEDWHETVARVVNGVYTLQKGHMIAHRLPWDEPRAQRSARSMYEHMFRMTFLPPGRGLWAHGTAITEERGLYSALYNCAFVDTLPPLPHDVGHEKNVQHLLTCFDFMLDKSMLGVGVGYSLNGAGTVRVYEPPECLPSGTKPVFLIEDSREGWVSSTQALIRSYLTPNTPEPNLDYGAIRPKGALIKTFGAFAAGPESLASLHERIRTILGANAGRPITSRSILDIMNAIGACVVAAGSRRSAQIAFRDAKADPAYLDFKNYDINPDRKDIGWASNNSIYAKLGQSYGDLARRVVHNGEPGTLWLENAQAYGRMADPPTHADARVTGGNPCLEISLESFEMCNLAELFPHRCANQAQFLEAVKYAFLYAKITTLGHTHWPASNAVMMRNRRVGVSLTGIAQFVESRGLHELKQWCNTGYGAIQRWDTYFSDLMAIPRSIKTTTIKPSGTVSLLAGATPGIHYPEALTYIRRVRMSNDSPFTRVLSDAGYHVEPDVTSPTTTSVLEMPVRIHDMKRTVADVSMWEQLSLAAFVQRYWSDNQVSATITFDPKSREGTPGEIARALDYFQYHLKGISLLPRTERGAYAQMPYEACSEERIADALERIRQAGGEQLDFSSVRVSMEPAMEQGCTTDVCELKAEEQDVAGKAATSGSPSATSGSPSATFLSATSPGSPAHVQEDDMTRNRAISIVRGWTDKRRWVIFTKEDCVHCVRAKATLRAAGEQGGYFVPLDDNPTLALALRHVLTDPELRRLDGDGAGEKENGGTKNSTVTVPIVFHWGKLVPGGANGLAEKLTSLGDDDIDE